MPSALDRTDVNPFSIPLRIASPRLRLFKRFRTLFSHCDPVAGMRERRYDDAVEG